MELSKVFILAGGEGTRLRPLTLTRPKSMIPLGPKPVIEHLISQITQSGFSEFIITVGHQKEQVMHHLGDGSHFGVTVNYSIEPEGIMLGTAGGVKLASHLLTDTFMVLQGDAYMTFDIAKALDVHRKTEADATIILREVLEPW
ncbi:MAG: nucleotidyltransferase family protein, partial [Candidatus Bathyarchaeota archaeon]